MAAPPPGQFTLAVLEKTGLSQTELGHRLGASHPYQRAHRLKNGDATPDYEETWAMLELAGWLTVDPEAALPTDPLRSLAADIQTILVVQQEVAVVLRTELAAIRERLGMSSAERGAGR